MIEQILLVLYHLKFLFLILSMKSLEFTLLASKYTYVLVHSLVAAAASDRMSGSPK
jgi:hypothetical protein